MASSSRRATRTGNPFFTLLTVVLIDAVTRRVIPPHILRMGGKGDAALSVPHEPSYAVCINRPPVGALST
jgi:hypothetical protein